MLLISSNLYYAAYLYLCGTLSIPQQKAA